MKIMKNNILYIIVLFLFVGLVSCDKDETEDLSRVTEFAAITLNGDNPMFLEVGEAYTEPGGETNTGDPITISGSVDSDTPGVYTISYSATNADGFTNTELRTVYVSNVGDLETSLEGLYTTTVTRVDPFEEYTEVQFVRIWEVGSGVYEISHTIGGFYAIGRGYGDDYAAKGATVTVNDMATNDFSYTGAIIPAWAADGPLSISDFTVDAETKTITYRVDWIGYVFNLTLVQYQF